MAINHWPSSERPREKLLDAGAESLSDAELLAIFLRTGIRGKSAVDLGRELLSEFGCLRNVLDADYSDFSATAGLGSVKYAHLQAALELGRRYLYEQLQEKKPVLNPHQIQHFLTSKLRHRQQEVFACLFLDTQHHVICFEELAEGTLDNAVVYPREMVKRALKHNAGAVILSHNHPSGVVRPSLSDRTLTKTISEALALVGTEVLDHIIIGEGEAFSFATHGLMEGL